MRVNPRTIVSTGPYPREDKEGSAVTACVATSAIVSLISAVGSGRGGCGVSLLEVDKSRGFLHRVALRGATAVPRGTTAVPRETT